MCESPSAKAGIHEAWVSLSLVRKLERWPLDARFAGKTVVGRVEMRVC